MHVPLPIDSMRQHPSSGLRGTLLEVEPAMARRGCALLGIAIALQDCLHPGVMAAGTKVVNGLYALSGTQQDGSEGRLPKFISCKLFLAAFHLDYLVAQFNGLLAKQYVFLSRLHYLFAQVGHSRTDVVHWQRLRRLKNQLQSINRTYDRVHSRGPVSGDFERILRGVHIEIHDLAFQSKANSRERRALAEASTEAA